MVLPVVSFILTKIIIIARLELQIILLYMITAKNNGESTGRKILLQQWLQNI
jgi:hypothetical protein